MDLFDAIAAERRMLADRLAPLSPDQQETQSLCEAWTVRQVVGHLVVPLEVGLPGFAWAIVKHRGNFDRANDSLARQQAQQPFTCLVDTLRRKADSRFTPPGNGPEAPLTDVLVHGLDIARPLGVSLEFPAADLKVALDHVSAQVGKSPGPWGGLRLQADDIDWAHGTGPLVTGNAASLLLALTGRVTGLHELQGAVPELLSNGEGS